MAYRISKILNFTVLTLSFFTFFLAILGVGTYLFFANDLNTKEEIMNNKDTGIILLDDQGKPFYTFYEAKNREYVRLSQISNYVRLAAVAHEDKEFYVHNGVSLRGISRSVILNFKNKRLNFGGSTITQQLVKNSLLSREKTLVRKLQEIVLAREIEKRYSKNEILEMYLNSVYFGEGTFGIEAAAKTYFSKSASDLNLAESAYLIGILSRPSDASPYSGDRKIAREKQKDVLLEMVQAGFIEEKEQDNALSYQLTFKASKNAVNSSATHFAIEVRDRLIEKFSEEKVIRSGFIVKTTLNSTWQRETEEALMGNVERLANNGVSNGAVVVMNPKNGEVKTLVGSVDWENERFGKLNMADSPRQPGSAFKPIVYGIAFEENLITSATILPDLPSQFVIKNCKINCVYAPRDYDDNFRGYVTVRRALANSLNVPAVHVMNKVGIRSVLEKSRELGITTLGRERDYGLSLVLGAGEVSVLEMAGVYSSFANYGIWTEPNFILQVYDKYGKEIAFDKPVKKRAWSQNVAFLISSILSDNIARAEIFGNTLNISRPAAVKTGTTTSYRSAWTIGYTPDLTIGIWMGNNNNKSMDNVAGSLGPAPLWRELMEKFHQNIAVKNFEPPQEVVKIAGCNISIPNSSASAYLENEYFIPGTVPAGCGGSINSAGIGGGPPNP